MDDGRLADRLTSLKEHLQQENPLLVDAVASFKRLDAVCRGLGLLGLDQSTISQIAWWPLISILGPFSAGKSTFINNYLDFPVQQTGSHVGVTPGIDFGPGGEGHLRFSYANSLENIEEGLDRLGRYITARCS